MQSKVNIFHSLQHASDSEEENDAQKNKAKKIAEKKEQRARPDDKNKSTANRGVPPGGNPDRQIKEEHARTKAPYKTKGVPEEPHPLDRHSGHGNQAYGGKPKKAGAGKGNWGNFKEDKRANEEPKEAVEGEEAAEEKPEEEKPAGITLSEYYQQRRQAQNEPQVNEAKAKITSEQLTKELGKATALVTRSQHQVDDRKVGKKKDRLDVNHHAAINSEHANLLNFRTGFVEKEYRQRGVEDASAPRKVGTRTGGQKERENAKEEDTQPQTIEGQATEAQSAEGVVQTQEGEVQASAQTQGQDNQNRRRNEGQRGGRGGYKGDRAQGDRPQGDRPQGDRPQGDRPRKQYGGKDQGKINFEDESAFPKLG